MFKLECSNVVSFSLEIRALVKLVGISAANSSVLVLEQNKTNFDASCMMVSSKFHC